MDEKYIHHFLFLPFVEFSGQVLAVRFQLFATDLIQLKVPASRIVVSLIGEIAMAKTWFLSFPCRAIVVSVPQFSRIFVENQASSNLKRKYLKNLSSKFLT